jgi:hypothetical protein
MSTPSRAPETVSCPESVRRGRALSRLVSQAILILAIMTAVWGGGRREAQAAPGGIPAEVAALQAAVATLQTAVAALQNATGRVEVWHGAAGFVNPIQHNTATSIADWTLTTLVSVSLPAGSFVLRAKAALLDTSEDSTVYCTLEDSTHPNGVTPGPLDWTWDSSFDDEPATVALQAVVSLSSPDTVTFKCGSTGPTTSASQAKLEALRAGPVH